MISHDCDDLVNLFDQIFLEPLNTRLIKGAFEPLYLPAKHSLLAAGVEVEPPQSDSVSYHRLFFRHDYYASALHEISHWCIAGVDRRKLVDFGYWYEPDGRNPEQQAEFQRIEAKPQAIEWILSQAAGYAFKVSLDNVDGASHTDLAKQTKGFGEKVLDEVYRYCEVGLPPRAEQFRVRLCEFYRTSAGLSPQNFSVRH